MAFMRFVDATPTISRRFPGQGAELAGEVCRGVAVIRTAHSAPGSSAFRSQRHASQHGVGKDHASRQIRLRGDDLRVGIGCFRLSGYRAVFTADDGAETEGFDVAGQVETQRIDLVLGSVAGGFGVGFG